MSSCAWHEETGRDGRRQRRAARPGARPRWLVALVVAAARTPRAGAARPRDRPSAAPPDRSRSRALGMARAEARRGGPRTRRPRRPLAGRPRRRGAGRAQPRARAEPRAGRARRDPVRPERAGPQRAAAGDAVRSAPVAAARRLGRAESRAAPARARNRVRLVARPDGRAGGGSGADPAPVGRARPARAVMGRRGVAAPRSPGAAGAAAVRARADARAAGHRRRPHSGLPRRAAPGRCRRRPPAA